MRISDWSSDVCSSDLIDVHAHLTVIPRDLLVENHWEPLAYLAFGVTTARDPSNGGEHGFAYGDLVEVGGMVGPRIFGTTAMVPSNFRIESYEDAVNSSKQMKALGATFTKYHSGWNRQQQRWIIRAAREVGLNVAAHLPYKMGRFDLRSEEHTSELQSLMRISYAVFCLKKKSTNIKPPDKT